MINAIAVPEGLEDAVGKAKCGDALDRVFPEKMVDPEYLILLEDMKEARVERTRGSEAVAERLFDHHTPPVPIVAFAILGLQRELCLAELLHDRTEELITNG